MSDEAPEAAKRPSDNLLAQKTPRRSRAGIWSVPHGAGRHCAALLLPDGTAGLAPAAGGRAPSIEEVATFVPRSRPSDDRANALASWSRVPTLSLEPVLEQYVQLQRKSPAEAFRLLRIDEPSSWSMSRNTALLIEQQLATSWRSPDPCRGVRKHVLALSAEIDLLQVVRIRAGLASRWSAASANALNGEGRPFRRNLHDIDEGTPVRRRSIDAAGSLKEAHYPPATAEPTKLGADVADVGGHRCVPGQTGC